MCDQEWRIPWLELPRVCAAQQPVSHTGGPHRERERGLAHAAERRMNQGERMAVMRMHDVRLDAPEILADQPPGTGIAPEGPRHFVDRYSRRGGELGQLAAAFRDEAELDIRVPRQLPRQQPHLILPAAPFAA